MVVVSGAVAWEFGRLFERAGHAVQPVLIVLCTAVVTASFLVPGAPIAVLVGATVLLLGSPLVAAGPVSSDGTTIGLTCLCYVGVLLGHALLLHQLTDGRALILFLARGDLGRRDAPPMRWVRPWGDTAGAADQPG